MLDGVRTGSRGSPWRRARLSAVAGLAGLVLFGAASGAFAQTRPADAVRTQPGPVAKVHPDPAEARRRLLDGVRSWGYQLRLLRFPEIAAAPLDLVVIDHALSAGRRFVHQFAPDLIQSAKRKPDGSRRLVLAYMSIGEAERYRFYWNQDWYDPARKPAWLGDLNPVWDGNYLVRFWHPEWQRFIVEGTDSYLARIQAAGFDGVYLDRADVHSEWVNEKPAAEAAAAMAAFVRRIALTARRSDPHFLVVMQNAEELVRQKPVLDSIDAIAKEDLFYGIDHNASPNDAGTVAGSLAHLRTARKAGRRVLVVEYLDDVAKVRDARRRSEAEGFLIHFTRRDLGDLATVAPDQQPGPPQPRPLPR